jgi:type II secretory pathway component PulM
MWPTLVGYVSSSDFHINLLSNVVSDLILAFILYWVLTQPQEKRAEKQRINDILGLLKAEIEKNLKRAEEYASAIGDPDIDVASLFPLRYTRGTWNTFKESGFIRHIKDLQLIHQLLEMNEATYTANRNIRRFQLAYLEPKDKDIHHLAENAVEDARQLSHVLSETLQRLAEHDLPAFELPEGSRYFDGQ